MSASYGCLRKWAMVVLIGCVVVGTSGCGYLKNVRDDALDCIVLGVGVVPPVAPTGDENKAVGLLPPSLGIYLEATEFLHLGALFKASADLEVDRRGMGVMLDRRLKAGIGPLHYASIWQKPLYANAYKDAEEPNQMDGWREHMRDLRDPVFNKPAKELIFEDRLDEGKWWLAEGWQDWETFSVEIAIPEPFILHSGFNVRAGFDPSQVFDLVLGLFTIDLYDDDAYNPWSGELQHTMGGE